jgi:hypothetical protein
MLSCAAQWQIGLGLAAVLETLTTVERAARPKRACGGWAGIDGLWSYDVALSGKRENFQRR